MILYVILIVNYLLLRKSDRSLVGKRLKNHTKICNVIYLYANIDFGKFHNHTNFNWINPEFSLSVAHVIDELDKFDFMIFYALKPRKTID